MQTSERPFRSHHYQYIFHELMVEQPFLNSFDNSKSIQGYLNPFEYNEDVLELQEDLIRILLALAEIHLTERQYKIFHMYFIQGLNQLDIADETGLNQSSIHKTINGDLYGPKKFGKVGGMTKYGGIIPKLKKLISNNKRVQEIVLEINNLQQERY